MAYRRAEKQRGFTLIETMVASIVLMVGLLPVVAVLISAMKANTFSQQIDNATTAGLDKLENLRRLDFDTAASVQVGGSLETDLPNYSDQYAAGTGPAAPGYRRRWQVFDSTADPPNQAPTAGSRMVVVSVVPLNTMSGAGKIVQMRTILVKKDD